MVSNRRRQRNLYFGSDRKGGKGRTDLYRCRLVNGKYTEAENSGDVINTKYDEFEPLIAPDESFLILWPVVPKDSEALIYISATIRMAYGRSP
jgi:hypothetical protein